MIRNEALVAQIDENGVGEFSLGDFAGVDSERAETAARRPAENLARGNGLGVARNFRQQRRELHFLAHVEIVVRRRAVRAERDAAAGARKRLPAENPRSELHVRGGIVNERHAALPQQGDFFVVEPDAVRGDDVPAEHAERIQPPHGGKPVRGDAVVDFLLRLGKMNVQPQTAFPRDVRAAPPQLFAHGVNRVRGDGETDASAPVRVPAEGERRKLREHFFPALVFHRVDERHGDFRAHSEFPRGARGFPVHEIHVVEERRSRTDHFQRGKPRTAVNVLGDQRILRRQNVFEKPVEQRHVVGVTAQQRHRRVRVRVAERRQNGEVFPVDDFRVRRSRGKAYRGSDFPEAVPGDQDVGLGSVQKHVFEKHSLHGVAEKKKRKVTIPAGNFQPPRSRRREARSGRRVPFSAAREHGGPRGKIFGTRGA